MAGISGSKETYTQGSNASAALLMINWPHGTRGFLCKVTPNRGFHNSKNLLAVARIILVTGQEFHPTTSLREQ